ncbi:hypothetical protein M899_0158 [Bacteriovorax sp. BSW11_IV]|uniref:hypothetical protein n=1 Tax=Bacteriovorax sp. BSW11_IV TaxID=1353529 RepID=UPI00038A22DE|nr:hypothetical protein [Bacteriovorax sp. BSW11_IV]EQC46980.1 hypothetical protein M899_0158 [Bacteriovorax sp. BSW11_IV]
MFKRIGLHTIMICVFIFTATAGFARDFIIYSIVQEVPMYKGHSPKKNFYINVGNQQGVFPGNTLEVFRVESRNDPYETKTRYNYKVKVGELEVVHSEKDSAIAIMSKLEDGEKAPLKEINNVMIGDLVDVKVK